METSTSAGFGGDSAQGVAAAGVSQRDVAASGGEEASDYGGMALESIRVAAETVGIAQLNEEAAKELAEEVSFRLRTLVQDAQKFAFHCHRRRLLASDIDHALRLQGQEPLYGISTSQHIPFRFASGGGREVYFTEEKEIDLSELTSAPLPKVPMGPSLRAHWLAIDGVQPAIPENPPAQTKDQLAQESSNPLSKLKRADAKENKLSQVLQSKPTKLKNMETVNVKQLATHELSVEQQLYYKEITEACVGSDEGRRAEALQSLACDPGLHQMLPRLCTFIAEGVRVNVVQHNLAILIYLMRMVKSLLENQTLFLEKYLHELIPAVTTCIVSRQLCTRPEVDNHWALRDFASRLMANICKNFNTSTNNIQTRVTRMLGEAMRNEKSPLVSYYGAIAGLQELGPEVIKVFILPHIRAISQRYDLANEPSMLASTQGNVEHTAARHIKNLIVKSVSPVLKTIRHSPDVLEEYTQEFGSLGAFLHNVVTRLRQQNQGGGGGSIANSAKLGSGSSQQQQPLSTVNRINQPSRLPPGSVAGSNVVLGQQVLLSPATPTGPGPQTRVILSQQPQHH